MQMTLGKSREIIDKIVFQPLIIYGMGYVGKLIAGWCDNNNVEYIYADRKISKESNLIMIHPSKIPLRYPDANVVIASINYFDEMKEYLKEIGVEETKILSYLMFWPDNVPWMELEQTVDWKNVELRAKKFSKWIDFQNEIVADYSCERNTLKRFLLQDVKYYSPEYMRLINNIPFADINKLDAAFETDVSYCMAMLMSFSNPNDLVTYMCEHTKNLIIASYVSTNQLPDCKLRRSINYNNDYTEEEIINSFAQKGFILQQKETDPFDEVHTVYLFQKDKH